MSVSYTYRIKIIKVFLLFCFAHISLSAQNFDDFQLLFNLRLQTIDPRLNISINSGIEEKISDLTSKETQQTEKDLQHFLFYQTYIQNELLKRNIPLSLQYLPLALSRMQTRYQGDYHRAGVWALPVFVALRYGLVVNSEIDERMDVIKSTKAAAMYLEQLFLIYNDFWDVVIAFAEGAPGLNAAKIRSHTDNTNPNELYDTGNFKDKEFLINFLSYAYLANYYERYGLSIKEQEAIKTQTVYLKKTVYIQHLSEKLNISRKEFADLNPVILSNTYIPVTDICIPSEKVNDFICMEDSLYDMYEMEILRQDSIALALASALAKKEEVEVKTITYVVKSGDYLGKIASRYHVGVSEIMKWNRLKSDKINIGQRLIIYKD